MAISLAKNPNQRLRIVVLGYVIRGPLGGMVWHHAQYLMGLQNLGHEVYFVEDSDDFPSCYDPVKGYTDTDPTYGLHFAAQIFDRIGMSDCWAYYDAHTKRWLGPSGARILHLCRNADLLLNLSGVNPLRPWFTPIPVRVLVDTDPVFTQVRHLTDAGAQSFAAQHTDFFSFAENIASSRADIPVDGFFWQPTRQPVVLDAWPTSSGPTEGSFTTVMQWDSYPAREYDGRRYGMKSDSFLSYLDIPQQVGSVFEVVVGGETARTALTTKGWQVLNPCDVIGDPWAYQHYIRQSKAEFSVAKQGYVASRSGWFSERSAAYLASGRPVVIQDTGFSDWLSTGAGVLPFSTPEEALAGIEDVNARYEFHCKTARAIAEEYFDARKVLPRLIETAVNFHPATNCSGSVVA